MNMADSPVDAETLFQIIGFAKGVAFCVAVSVVVCVTLWVWGR